MSTFDKQIIVFGLLVLTISSTEAHFKPFEKPSTSTNIRLRSQASSFSRRRIPSQMSSSSSVGGSTSDIYRTASSPTLNTANSPSIMQEISLHREAAASLNSGRVNIFQPRRSNNPIRRLMPNSEQLSKIGTVFKYSAIGAAGVGGSISIIKAFSKDSSQTEKNDEQNTSLSTTTTTATTTTVLPEIYNPIGTDI